MSENVFWNWFVSVDAVHSGCSYSSHPTARKQVPTSPNFGRGAGGGLYRLPLGDDEVSVTTGLEL
jgi:hypothetical protein